MDQNGGLEGESIAVFVRIEWRDCITFTKEVRQHGFIVIGGGAASGGGTVIRTVTECDERAKSGPTVQVTPC